MKKYFTLNNIMQVGLLVFTTAGFLLMSLKQPQYGLILSLIAQIFWIYASYKAWKEAGQIGIFINTLVLIGVFGYGVLNYWVL
ncbi:MAG: hypothetical protein PHN60_02290 [Candidatus Gracilibacteria bacterium]|nr:hypothetical protein [Candidatus Gracilibacteria bacterium]